MFHHGITAKEKNQGVLPIRNADISTIGLVVVSDDADNTRYPIGKPVLLTGITDSDFELAGTTGTLLASLKAIRDIVNPTIVVLRIEQGNINQVDELRKAQSLLGKTPKILGAPQIDIPEMTAKLISIAKETRAFVYASPRNADGTPITDLPGIQAYRDSFGDRELMLIENEWSTPEVAALTKACIPTTLSVPFSVEEPSGNIVMNYMINDGEVQTYSAASGGVAASIPQLFWNFLLSIGAVSGGSGGNGYFKPNYGVTGLPPGEPVLFSGLSTDLQNIEGEKVVTESPYELTLLPSNVGLGDYDLFAQVTGNATEPVKLHSCGFQNFPGI